MSVTLLKGCDSLWDGMELNWWTLVHGCVPVIIHEHLHMPFDELLDWRSFAVWVHRRDLGELNVTLARLVDSGEYARLQRNLVSVWPFLYWHRGKYKTTTKTDDDGSHVVDHDDDPWRGEGVSEAPRLFGMYGGECQRGEGFEKDFDVR